MNHESLIQYVGCTVKLILSNNFWYKGEVISVSEKEFAFVDIKGNNISIDPDFILMIEEVGE